VLDVQKRARGQEALDDAHQALHLALGLRTVGPAGIGRDPVVGAEAHPAVGEDRGLVRCPGSGDHRLHVVDQELSGEAADLGEGGRDAGDERVLGLIGTGVSDAVAAEAHLQREEDDALDLARQERDPDLAEVHLGLVTGKGLESHGGSV
jgi:hypothetical protein